MRNYVLDGHTHTQPDMEWGEAASRRGLEMFGLTEHGPEMPGSATAMFFANYRIIPPVINNVKVLKGMESNIMDKDGTIDVPEAFADSLSPYPLYRAGLKGR